MKSIKKTIINTGIFILLIILTFLILFKDQELKLILDIVNNANKGFILLGLCAMLLYFLAEAYNVKSILKTFGEKVSILKTLKFTFIGFFFSAITPAASGGQPMEVYYMTKDGISGANATLTMLIQLCGFQISTLSLGIICAILMPSIFENGLLWLFLIGILINGVALIAMLTCIFSKKLTSILVNLFIRFLRFCKYKKTDEKLNSINEGLKVYHESAIYIKQHKHEFIKSILRVFVQILLYYLVPFFVYKAFGLDEYSILELIAMQAILYTTTSGLPLPGAIGVSETTFLIIFGPVFGMGLLNSAMLLNRGINFYGFVIISAMVVIFNAFRVKTFLTKKVAELN